ncbi:hypothetical protein OA343_03100 [Paracoccaceae bacterium]|nr:hypothetical protein [Paracoccaceae bacterium]
MSKSSSTRFYTRLFYKLAIVVSLNCIILGVWLIADWPSKLYALSNMPADIYEKNSKASFYIVVIFVYTILWPIFLLFLGYKQVRAFYLEHSLISKLETFEQTKIELLQRLDKEDKILTWDFRKGILVLVAVLLTFWIFLKLNHD